MACKLEPVEPEKTVNTEKAPLISQGALVTLFVTLASFNLFYSRYNLSVAIVAMVSNSTENSVSLNSTEENVTMDRISDPNKLDWDRDTTSLVLSAYFYGYTFLQIPAGTLCEYFGFQRPLFISTIISCLLTVITPWAARYSSFAILCVRLLLGAAHTCFLSCGYGAIATWIPPLQKATAVVWLAIGIELGGLLTLLITGWISGEPSLGWEASFYLAGVFPLLWLVPYYFLVYENPDENPYISNYELISLGYPPKEDVEMTEKDSKKESESKITHTRNFVPIGQLLTTPTFYGTCIAKFAQSFGYYVITIKMPAYLNEEMGVSISENGAFCALSYLGVLTSKIFCVLFERYSHLPLSYKQLTNRRRGFQLAAGLIPGLALASLYLFPGHFVLAVVFLVIAQFGTGFSVSGEGANLMEYAGSQSPLIFSISNTFACLDGMIAPLATAKILDWAPDSTTGWRNVFLLSALVSVTGCLLFTCLADSAPQKWCKEKQEKLKSNEKSTQNEPISTISKNI